MHHNCLKAFVLCSVGLLCPTLCNPMDCNPSGSSVRGDSPGKNTVVGCHAFLQGNLPSSGSKPRSPILQVDSLLSEAPGKPLLGIWFVSNYFMIISSAMWNFFVFFSIKFGLHIRFCFPFLNFRIRLLVKSVI